MRILLRWLADLRRCQAGSTAIEFAIISVPLIFVSLGIIEFGRAFNVRNDVSFAADFAARRILNGGTVTDAELTDEIRAAFTGYDPDRLVIALGSVTVNGVDFRTVDIEYPFDLLLPGFTEQPIRLGLSRRVPVNPTL